MRLWEEVGTQLKGVTEALKDLTREMRDVSERLVRIESQDQPAKLAALEDDLREALVDVSDAKHEAQLALATVRQDHQTEMALIRSDHAADKLALEKRLTRMEIIIAPLTVGGSAFLAAVIGALAAAFSSGLGHH